MKSNPSPHTLEKFPEVMELLFARLDSIDQRLGNNPGSVNTPEKPITTKELCEYLNITEPTVIRWKKKGKIPYFRIGSAIRYNLKDVLKSLEKPTR
jgi:excisionase family DNA binding protein